VPAGDATVSLRSAGRTLATITVGRDRANLEAEVELERDGSRLSTLGAR